jgi:UDP-N-acetylmuramoylalanine--D-glutamate ligase
MTQFLDVVATHAAHVVLLPGSATDKVQGGLRSRGFEPGLPVTSMSEAVARATVYATAGDVVILSPGLASFGLFRNEFDRGEQFRQAVRTIAAEVDT